jgi:hypothetical protein
MPIPEILSINNETNPDEGGSKCQLSDQSNHSRVITLQSDEMTSGTPSKYQNFVLSKQFFREVFAEFVGTFILVSLGTGSTMSDIYGGALEGLFQNASIWGIAVTLAISTTGHISGAHLNPAISIAFAMFRPCPQFGWFKVLPYIVAQTAGAILASFVNLLMYGSLIQEFEDSHGIIRGSAESVASALAFGEYFLYVCDSSLHCDDPTSSISET